MHNVYPELQEMMSSIVRALTESPEKATVTIDTEHLPVTCRVTVAKEDVGTLIGKQGRTARSIRILVAIYATKVKQPISVDFGTL